jgi:hypothetical protein
MKKLIAICAVSLSLGAFADSDSYLYWFVQDSVTWKTGDTAANYDTVRIGVLNSSGDKVTDNSGSAVYLSLYSITDTSKSYDSMGLDRDSGLGNSGYAALGTYAGEGYSYYIELLNDTTFAGRSVDTLAYSSAATWILTDISQTAIPSSAWSSATYTTAPVPEPTSGMLLLFGLAGLALRRKRT